MSENNIYEPKWRIIHKLFLAAMVVICLFSPYWVFGIVPFFTGGEDPVMDTARQDVSLPAGLSLTWASAEEEKQALDDFQWCRNCHSLKDGEKHRTGPNIFQILGAPVASKPKFYYSESFISLRDKGEIWTYEKLDAFIKNPKEQIPGTRMRYPPAIFENMQNDEARTRAMKYMLIATQ